MLTTRRTMILAGATALFAHRGETAEDLPAGMITLSPRPADLEMPVEGFIDEITPTSHFFVRTHTYVPEVKVADWTLKIDGMVDNPLRFTLPELKEFPHTSLVSV